MRTEKNCALKNNYLFYMNEMGRVINPYHIVTRSLEKSYQVLAYLMWIISLVNETCIFMIS